MELQIIPTSSQEHWLELRTKDLTSTEAAVLFNHSPYQTYFELWHAKKSGRSSSFTQNERMKWGNRLEAAIAHGIAQEQGWEIVPMKDYWRVPGLRIGSSFDFMITSGDEPEHLEIKNVDWLQYRDKWIEHDDGYIEAPLHIELQVQHQMAVSGFKRAHIGVLVGGNEAKLLTRERDENAIAAIRHQASTFWKSIDADEAPNPDLTRDADAIIGMYNYAEPGKIVDASSDEEIASLIAAYKEHKAEMGRHEDIAKAIKADVLLRIGDAEKVICGEYTLSTGIVADVPATEITPEMVGLSYGGRKGYRAFTVTKKKSTKKAA